MDEQTQPVEGSVKEFEVGAPATTADIYVGSAKVTPVTLPSGLISVTIEGVEIKSTQEQFDAMKSSAPYEDGLVMIRKWRPTIAKVLAILVADNTEMQDKDFVMQRVDTSILENFRAASAKLFNVTDNGHVTLQQVVDIISPKV
jgi:hypothetical protein